MKIEKFGNLLIETKDKKVSFSINNFEFSSDGHRVPFPANSGSELQDIKSNREVVKKVLGWVKYEVTEALKELVEEL